MLHINDRGETSLPCPGNTLNNIEKIREEACAQGLTADNVKRLGLLFPWKGDANFPSKPKERPKLCTYKTA